MNKCRSCLRKSASGNPIAIARFRIHIASGPIAHAASLNRFMTTIPNRSLNTSVRDPAELSQTDLADVPSTSETSSGDQNAGSRRKYRSRDATEEESLASRNSVTLRQKTEHLIRMGDIEAAEQLVRRSGWFHPGSEHAFNSLLRYMSMDGKFDESWRLYQTVYYVSYVR
jgi:hypothetical protein